MYFNVILFKIKYYGSILINYGSNFPPPTNIDYILTNSAH